MRNSEKRMILTIIVIGVIIIGIIMLVKNNSKENTEEAVEGTEISQVVENEGVKENTSSKIKEEKQVKGLKVNVISITEKNGIAEIRATITNETEIEQNEFPISIHLKNEEGETVQKVGAYVGKIKPNETRQIVASVNMNIDEIYDVEFKAN